MTVGALSMAAAILLAFLRVPLGFALLAVSVAGIGLAVNWTVAFQLLPFTISDAVLNYDLAVVPMFILMGNIIAKTGIAQDLFRAAHAFVGHVRGGLALSTMMSCAGFSAVCGSSYATAATMAKPMPVLPLVGSTIVPPGFRAPEPSASSTMASAMRSFIDPPGLLRSLFTHTS